MVSDPPGDPNSPNAPWPPSLMSEFLTCLGQEDLRPDDQFVLSRGWKYLVLVWRRPETPEEFPRLVGWTKARYIPSQDGPPFKDALDYFNRTGKGMEVPK